MKEIVLQYFSSIYFFFYFKWDFFRCSFQAYSEIDILQDEHFSQENSSNFLATKLWNWTGFAIHVMFWT